MSTSESTSISEHVRGTASPAWTRIAACILTPWAVVYLVLALSPNFALLQSVSTFDSAAVRDGSYGGDLLQEYVGGVLWNENRKQLYDWEHSKTVQHDSEIVGFSWRGDAWFPMVYPPFHYQFASLFSNMSYRSFAILWSFAGSIALSISAFSILTWYRELEVGREHWMFAGLLFMPLLVSISMGQKSTFLLAILTVSFVLLHREKAFAAGIVFGLIAIKPHFAIVIGLAMLMKGQFRFVLGSLTTLCVLVSASLIGGPTVWQDYIHVCLGMSDYLSNGGYQLTESHSLLGAMEFMLRDAAPWLAKPIAFAASIGVVVLLGSALRGKMETTSTKFAFQFSAMIIATVLLSPHFYTYDLTILLLPLLLCGLSRTGPQASGQPNDLGITLMCIALLFGIGVCRSLAVTTGFQASIVMLIGMLWLIVSRVNDGQPWLGRRGVEFH